MEHPHLEKCTALSRERLLVERDELALKYDQFMTLALVEPRDSQKFSYYIGVADAIRALLDHFKYAVNL
jgi:hypothetical protein